MVPAPSSSADPGTGSGSRSSSTNRSRGAFVRHVGRAFGRFDDLLPFALVPLVLSLLEVEKIQRALAPTRDVSVNLEFAFPTPLLDLWSFVSPPESTTGGSVGSQAPGSTDEFPFGDSPSDPTGVGGSGTGSGTGLNSDVPIETPVDTIVVPVDTITVDALGWIGLLLFAYAVIAAVVAAGYLGGIDRRLRGAPISILECVVRYAPQLFLYYAILFGGFLALVLPALVAPPLQVLAFPAVIVLGYLFYAAPFLLVVADAGLLEALRRSYGYALEGGAYFYFALGHMVVAAVVSGILSLLVSTTGASGFLVALVVTVPLGLVLTAATVSFCQELVDHDGARRTAVSGGIP